MLEINIEDAYYIIHESFKNSPIHITKENCPSYSGFITFQQFKRSYDNITILGYKNIACVGIEKKSASRYKIKHLAVLEKYRHQGYGSKLMLEAEQYIKSNGGIKIQLGMLYDHKNLMAFYENLGYRLVKKKEHPRKLTIAFMEKTL